MATEVVSKIALVTCANDTIRPGSSSIDPDQAWACQVDLNKEMSVLLLNEKLLKKVTPTPTHSKFVGSNQSYSTQKIRVHDNENLPMFIA